MKNYRKLAVMLVFVLSFSCVGAFAASYYWSFQLDAGHYDYSTSQKKADDEQFAYVRIDGGNLREYDKVYFRVRRTSDDAMMTESKWANTTGIRFDLEYTERTGVPQERYRLKMQQDSGAADMVWADGYWTP